MGESAHILIDGARSHVGITVTRVESLPDGQVQLWSEECGDEAFDVDKLFVQKIGDRNKGRLAVKGSLPCKK